MSYARETTLIVFERSALQGVERGVPVLRPGWILPLTCGRRKEWRPNATTTDSKLREVLKSVKLKAEAHLCRLGTKTTGVSRAVDEVDKFCEWLEYQWRDGPKALPSSLRPPGELVGEIIKYFRKPQVAGIRLVADISLGQTLRIVNQGDVDFEQQITSMHLNGATVQTAASGSEIGVKVDQRAPEGAKVYRVGD